VSQVFGSWAAALRAAGLEPRKRPRLARCKWGHSLTDPLNVYVEPGSGKRCCRECARIKGREWYARQPRAVRPVKTHCKHGHSLTDPAAVHTDPRTGVRSCRECQRNNQRKYRARRLALHAAGAEPKPPRKAHCKHGHSLTDEANLYVNPNSGIWVCRACHAIQQRKRRARRKGQS
jgi:hypothetical protein